jgi:POT family proton-dependent oligopeptide transporter
MTPTLESIRDFRGTYPRQLWWLFLTEMWERFCFYGLRGMLTVFMVTQLDLGEKDANLQYGAIQAFVYAFTFIGGVMADKILGFQRSLFWGALLMIAGGAIIAVSPTELFYLGITFNIIGTGFFKPNISTMVGQLYHENDTRRDAGFGLFYSGINIGAFLGGVLMVYIGKFHSWPMAFGLVAVVMTISLITFAFTRKGLGPIGLSPLAHLPKMKATQREAAVYVGSLLSIPLILEMVTNTAYTDLFMWIVGPSTLVYLAWEMRQFTAAENKKLGAALVLILFSVLFWAVFEQSGGSMSVFALNNITPTFGGLSLDPNVSNNSANSLFVILFSPILMFLWVALAKRKAEPNSVVKFGLAFLLLAFAFYVFYATVFVANPETGMTSQEIFVLGYFIITFGELFLSPIGLSLMTKLSPTRIQGLMMGMWFLASAYGQYVAGLLGAGMAQVGDNVTNLERLTGYTDGYLYLAQIAAVGGVVLLVISPLVRKLMGSVR